MQDDTAANQTENHQEEKLPGITRQQTYNLQISQVKDLQVVPGSEKINKLNKRKIIHYTGTKNSNRLVVLG